MMKWNNKLAMLALALTMTASGAAAGAEAVTEAETAGSVEDKIASAAEMTTVDDVIEDWMVPIPAEDIADGEYEVTMESSSSMFPVVGCKLTVSDGAMSAVMTMGGQGYLSVYPGTPEEAAAAPEEDYSPYVENENGLQTYEIPVEALDAPIKCAAFSKNKEKWYDRTLVIVSTSLPAGALKKVQMTTAEDLGLADGAYTIEAELQGGSGKASISSPAVITVEGGEMTAEIIFSSPNYDYVLFGDERYEPVNTEGNSTFLLPVPGFDYNMPIIADTVAMSKPHEISYTIWMDSATLTEQ